MSVKVLIFAGSTRTGSYNKRLATAAAQAARDAGAEVTHIDLRDFPMPLYDGDLEEAQGLPEAAHRFRKLMREHDAFIIASPEYNSSISGVLKNTIDWASRPQPNEKPLECFTGKVALLMAASTGQLGGLRGLVTVRSILGNIGVIVLPEQRAVPKANDVLLEDGSITDATLRDALAKMTKRLVEVTGKLKA